MSQVGTEGLALFESSTASPPAKRTPPSLADRYAAWRASKEGELVFRDIEARCLAEARLSPERIAVARHVEEARVERKVHVNQNHRAFIARELVRTHPQLKPLIEIRGVA